MEPYFVQKPDLSESGPGLRVTWLGHATVLVEIDGLNVLTDPMFSQRASPVQFMGPKRYRGPPCTVEQVEYLLSEYLTQFRIVWLVLYRLFPVDSCPGSMQCSSATLIMTTWTLLLFPVWTPALAGRYAGVFTLNISLDQLDQTIDVTCSISVILAVMSKCSSGGSCPWVWWTGWWRWAVRTWSSWTGGKRTACRAMMTSRLSAPPPSTGVNEQHWTITRYCADGRHPSGHFSLIIGEFFLLLSLCGAAGLFWVQTIDSSLLVTPAIALASRRSDGGLGPLTSQRSPSALTRPGCAQGTHFIRHHCKKLFIDLKNRYTYMYLESLSFQGYDEGTTRRPRRGCKDSPRPSGETVCGHSLGNLCSYLWGEQGGGDPLSTPHIHLSLPPQVPC